MNQTTCALCSSGELFPIIDLGFHPLGDTFLTKDEVSEPETHYPLKVLLCKACGHGMLSYFVSPTLRETNYSYTSGNSKVSVEHFDKYGEGVLKRYPLSGDDLVIDIGSNDGTLLQAFKKHGAPKILGIEPSPVVANLAKKAGVPTIEKFFSKDLLTEIRTYGNPKIITATNVFNHIDDIRGFLEALSDLLPEGGVFVPEVPYLKTMVERTSFDVIYLEHTAFYSIKPIALFVKKYGFAISHIEINDYMGGSVRLFIEKGGKESPLVEEFVKKEEETKLFDPKTYGSFMERTRQFKFKLMKELYEAKASGGKIIGIGAATKGNTLLNFCGIDASLVEFVTDSSPLKVGKYTPGSHIPIKKDEDITPEITHALILPWNIAEFLVSKLGHLKVKFLIPQMNIK